MAFDPIIVECTPAQVLQPIRDGLTMFRDSTDGFFKAKRWDGTIITIGGGGGGAGWLIAGNAGTNPAINFVGTTDLVDLAFRTNNIEVARFLSTGELKLLFDILDNAGVISIKPTARILVDSTGIFDSVDWQNRRLSDSGAILSLDWQGRETKDITAVRSLNWNTRIAYDALNVASINWANRRTFDNAGLPSIDYNSRTLGDNLGQGSVDWQTRQLSDVAGISALSWSNRILYNTLSVDVLNWNGNLLLAQTGAVNVSINQPVPLYLFHIKATLASFTTEYIESPNGLGSVELGFSGDGGIFRMKDSTGALTVQIDSGGSSFITGGNVGIGTNSPNVSALLELASTTGALLVSRMTSAQEGALTPINGMIIYNTDTNKFRGYENGAWVNLI